MLPVLQLRITRLPELSGGCDESLLLHEAKGARKLPHQKEEEFDCAQYKRIALLSRDLTIPHR